VGFSQANTTEAADPPKTDEAIVADPAQGADGRYFEKYRLVSADEGN
jgi:hypothetical protein